MTTAPSIPDCSPSLGRWLLLALVLLGIHHAQGNTDAAAPADPLHLPHPPAPVTAPTFTEALPDPALPEVSVDPLDSLTDPAAPPDSAPHSPDTGAASEALTPAERALESAHLLPLDQTTDTTAEQIRLQKLQTDLALARQQRRERSFDLARRGLMSLLEGIQVPEDLQRGALLELALVEQDAGEWTQAQRVFAHYISIYPQHPSLPEVLLRQGLLYREMGATGLAIAKFYAVMTSALNLKLSQLEHYERLVLQAQSEIGETHFALGRFEAAADCFRRLLKRQSPQLNKEQVHFKFILCLGRLGDPEETISQAQRFVEAYPDSAAIPEVRFLLARTFKQSGRAADAQRQVLTLLEAQREAGRRNPESWAYWQKRAGNEIANQFYQEGDFPTTLAIYQHLLALDPSPAWQIPVLYQIGLVYERLLQAPQASATYASLLDRQKELTADQLTPSLASIIEMARWRQEALAWLDKAQADVLALRTHAGTSP